MITKDDENAINGDNDRTFIRLTTFFVNLIEDFNNF